MAREKGRGKNVTEHTFKRRARLWFGVELSDSQATRVKLEHDMKNNRGRSARAVEKTLIQFTEYLEIEK